MTQTQFGDMLTLLKQTNVSNLRRFDMTITNEQAGAFAQVLIKVAELQYALNALNRLHPTTNVGLDELCDDLYQ
mgnify:FL=1